MNWDTLTADVKMLVPVHYTKGRSGRSIRHVVVHYNAGNLTVAGCYSVWLTRAASAHYQVEDDGTIGQLVWDSNTAWHAGNWVENCQSIGIEHANRPDGTITEKCLDAGAHLVAAICRYYRLGRPSWLNVVFPHRYFQATSCPGQIYGSQRQAYMARCQYWYDVMSGRDVEDPGVSQTPETPESTTTGTSGTGFGGTYVCNSTDLNVREAPTTSAKVVAQYTRGQTVTLDDWYRIADGYVWGRYTGASSGEKRYVAVGRATGKPESDDLLVRHVVESKPATSSDFRGGAYRCNVDVLNVRSSPSTSASMVAQYKRGQTVNLDDWYQIADGYVWARYTGATSGKKRYVAVGPATGKAEASDFLVRA